MTDSDLIYGLFATFDYQCFSIRQLKCLTAPFEVSETSLRSVLSRMKKQGVLEISRKGRTAFYTPTGKCRNYGGNVARAFKEQNPIDWSGEMVTAAFSISDSSARYSLQKRLREYRFATIFPGVWIRPYLGYEKYDEVFEEVIKTKCCCLTIGPMFPELTREDAAVLWNLEKLSEQMRRQIHRTQESYKYLNELSAEEVFRKKMEEGDAAVRILAEDPMLPAVLQDKTWPGAELRQEFFKFNKKATELSLPFWSSCLRS